MAWVYEKLYTLDPEMKTFSAFNAEVVSGGQLLAASGADDVLSSGVVAWGDLKVVKGSTIGVQANCIGVALQNTAISGPVAVITDGFLVLNAGSDAFDDGVTPGYKVMPDIGFTGVVDAPAAGSGTWIIGRAWTGASTKNKAVFVRLRA